MTGLFYFTHLLAPGNGQVLSATLADKSRLLIDSKAQTVKRQLISEAGFACDGGEQVAESVIFFDDTLSNSPLSSISAQPLGDIRQAASR